jgi:hypothetical protein
MRWILVWWVIHPGHSQLMHTEYFASESQCAEHAEQLQPAPGKDMRKHCSMR